ncbi:hypothetical protein AB0J01_37765 [Streptomyces sp. NPDC050204]|uniref:hypothetical protein n=1 Tax=Streptomyces sp. NPDC050204 TaxID=3155514 RepID=UPI00341F8F29
MPAASSPRTPPRDRARWTVINLPAVADTAADDTADDVLGRAVGEPLWPERFGLEHLQNFREEVGERGWWALYQQQPRPLEGGIWQWSWIRNHHHHRAAARHHPHPHRRRRRTRRRRRGQ